MDVRYVVVRGRGEDDPVLFSEIVAPVLCETKEAAEAVLAETPSSMDEDEDGMAWDWSVFEVVDGKCRQRSVVWASGSPQIQPEGA